MVPQRLVELAVLLFLTAYDGIRSYEVARLVGPRPCLDFGQTDYHKHDTHSRTFAILITEDGFKEVTVSV
jgi:hypothetical protein